MVAYNWILNNMGIMLTFLTVKNVHNFTVSPWYLQFGIHGFNQPWIVSYCSIYLLKKIHIQMGSCCSNLCCWRFNCIFIAKKVMTLKHYLEYKKPHTHTLIHAVYDHISMRIKREATNYSDESKHKDYCS